MNKVKFYYDNRVKEEWARADRYRIEHAITLRIFDKWLPKTPGLRIGDIGGGPGRYSILLTKRGYNVTLFDLSKKNLQYAKKQAKKEKIVISNFINGAATDMSMIRDNSFDAVLLMGPLYHLIDHHKRQKAILEANRILVKGGIIFASFITPSKPLRLIAQEDPQWAYKHSKVIEEIISSGILREPIILNDIPFLTEMYFIDPEAVLPLMESGGFRTISLYGVGVFGGQGYKRVNSLRGVALKWWIDLNWRFSTNHYLALTSDQLFYVGKKA